MYQANYHQTLECREVWNDVLEKVYYNGLMEGRHAGLLGRCEEKEKVLGRQSNQAQNN